MAKEDLDEQIEAEVSEWSSNSNDCFQIDLLRRDGSEHASFQPAFTYPMFGEQEAIFGYKDLFINLQFAAHNLEPRLHISYEKAFKEQGDIKPTDIKAALVDFLPEEAFSNTELSLQDATTYVPPGDIIRRYKRGDESFQVSCASLAEPDAKQLLERMQILVSFFIEGGSALQLEQDWTTERWKLFTLWSVQESGEGTEYAMVGYGTSYQIFTLPERTSESEPISSSTNEPDFPPFTSNTAVKSPLDLLSRERLSQFLVLPSFQKSGHGTELYRAMYKALSSPSNIREFTVEDPNEAFDDMRDFCDLTWLRAQYPEFSNLTINADIDTNLLVSDKEVPVQAIVAKDVRNSIRKRSKIIQRQFDRLVEMQTLSLIPKANRTRARITRREKTTNINDKKYYLWRMYTKQRVMIFNHEALIQLDPAERADKLEAVVDSNQEHYSEMIDRVLQKESEGLDLHGDPVSVSGSNGVAKSVKKRKVIEDDEDEEMDDASVASKRLKEG
ncbi:hypothetical protein MRB53_038562 [Persea americana]|nr:hypothetical protein MRB53_038562 [Persea americana]